ncbi:hypothetical protein EWM64_g3428 [Hericium alpestre]|uniref:Peptidyl-prolyl isomerase CWC27 n=1 Tax=Hericium alpestre TaxID=135208 RepID=A0A4Z0A1K8_9AGAM|nr:hypothetical protein EWM64_g3428 [Hericium alpestre]
MALPTKGRVVIDTTAGDIEIELWSKEAPKAVRNFLALAMEGYYDGVIFHRIVPDFLVQTGDRTGTGGGGESFYGEPFEDEIHPRLRFAHRGLVAMANKGTKNSNDSQFFITLDRADELHGKHTLFGRVVGDTIYNVMKIGEMEIDDNQRPVYPPKIRSIKILENPFDDIVPRITAEEKRVQQRAREQAKREREDRERRKGAKKDTKLLSFGAEEDIEGEPGPSAFKKKNIVRPDLAEDVSQPMAIPDFTSPSFTSKPSKADDRSIEKQAKQDKLTASKESDLARIREKHAKEQAASSNTRQAEIEKMEAEIRKLTKRRGGEDSDEEVSKKKAKKSYLEEELSKYSKGRGLHKKQRKKDESDVLAALTSFRTKLQGSKSSELPDEEETEAREEQAQTGEEPGMEVDDDRGFMSHLLQVPKGNDEEAQKAERDYEVIDPRQRAMATKAAFKRLSKEYVAMQKEPPPFVWAAPDEKDILTCIKMYTPSGRFQPDKKICFSMSDFHPGTWNPAWSVATILTGLVSFMMSDEMTTGSVTTSDADKRAYALRSHTWNLESRRFKEAFPEYCTPLPRDPPNMAEKDRGKPEPAASSPAPVPTSAPVRTSQASTSVATVAAATARNVAAARPRKITKPSGVAATPGVGEASRGWATSWRQMVWEKWRWGVLIALAVIVSRITSGV